MSEATKGWVDLGSVTTTLNSYEPITKEMIFKGIGVLKANSAPGNWGHAQNEFSIPMLKQKSPQYTCTIEDIGGGRKVILIKHPTMCAFTVVPVMAEFMVSDIELLNHVKPKAFLSELWDNMIQQIFRQAAKAFIPKQSQGKKK